MSRKTTSMDANSEEARHYREIALIAELNGESDRACAVVGAAWVEESLQQAIESVLHPHEKARERLFAGTGPLGTFAAKIDLACVFGFMTDAIRSDLEAIRRIRNEFAHLVVHRDTHARVTFASESIAHRCLALRSVAYLKPTNPREAYTRACVTLNADFEFITFASGKIPDAGRVLAQGIDPVRAP